MKGWIQRMIGKAVMAVLGLGLWLGYMTMCDGGDGGDVQRVAELPAVVFGGGGGAIAIDLELNQPGHLTASFEQWDEAREESLELGARQELAPGTHRFELDLAESTYGYLEVGIPDATPGARIRWSVDLDGQTLHRDQIELEKPLESGYAFFVQLEFDDVAQLRRYAQR